MARPQSVKCEVCGKRVTVAPRGKVPRFCADHSSADLPEPDDIPTTGAPAAVASEEAGASALAGSPDEAQGEVGHLSPATSDEWPQQVAPCVWVGPGGERWTDLGEAERGMAEIRRKT